MGTYNFELNRTGVVVTQKAFFPLILGCSVILGAGIGLYFWATDLQILIGLDYWMPLFISVGSAFGGIYLVFIRSYSKELCFILGSNNLRVVDRSMIRAKTRDLVHAGLETLTVKKTDNDGYWYTPLLKLSDGGRIEIGFGCPSFASAMFVVERIKETDECVRKKHSGYILNKVP